MEGDASNAKRAAAEVESHATTWLAAGCCKSMERLTSQQLHGALMGVRVAWQVDENWNDRSVRSREAWERRVRWWWAVLAAAARKVASAILARAPDGDEPSG